jgi:hypothetical protein
VQPSTKKQAIEKQVLSSTRGTKRKPSSIQDNPSSNNPSKPSKIPRRHISISTQLITKDYSRITRSYTARQKNENVNTKLQKEAELPRKRKLSASASTKNSSKKQRLKIVEDESIGVNKREDEKTKQEKTEVQKSLP